jgi:putative endonuclease
MGEIDIIAREGPTIVFVEVKARTSSRFGPPSAAVTSRKQCRLARLALDYLLQRGWLDHPCRFDVVSILMTPGDRPSLEVVPGAFDVGGSW